MFIYFLFFQSVMAHCIWLTDDEIYTLRERGVGISHCPNSNVSIRSGLCDIRRLLNSGLKVGLGTGMSGITIEFNFI